jgi:hypothetical protein
MLHALVTVLGAAAEHAKEDEPDKVPFYVAGAGLAAWAVIVSVVGIRSPDFPGAGRVARGVMALSILLVLVTVSAAVLTS